MPEARVDPVSIPVELLDSTAAALADVRGAGRGWVRATNADGTLVRPVHGIPTFLQCGNWAPAACPRSAADRAAPHAGDRATPSAGPNGLAVVER